MNNLKEKGRFRLLTTRIVSFMMAFFMVFTTVMSAMSSTAYAASQYGDPVTLTIKDTEHGELSFDGSNSKKITVQRGSNVSVLVKPEVGYEAKTVKMDGKNPTDLPVLNGQVNVPAIADAVLSASFIQTEQSKVATVKEDNKENKTELEKQIETEKKKPANVEADKKDKRSKSEKETIDDSKTIAEILLKADRSKVGEGTNVTPVDVVTVANTLINVNKTKARTLDDFWVDKDKDGIFDNFEAMEMQFDGLVPLYKISDEAEYLVAKPNVAQVENSKFLEYQIADSNMSGTTLDTVIYDKETGLLYVPKNVVLPNDPKYKRPEKIVRYGRTRIQFLLGVDKAAKDTKTKVKVDVEKNDKVDGEVSEAGTLEANTLSDSTKILLAKDDKSKKSIKKESIDEVRINGHKVDSEKVEYHEKEGVLEIPTKPADVDNVEVKMSNSFAKDVKRVVGSLLAPVKSLAGEPTILVSRTFYFNDDVYFNDVWDLKAHNVSTKSHNAKYEQAWSGGSKFGSDARSFQTVKSLLDHALTKSDADIIGAAIGNDAGFGYYTRHSTIAKQLVGAAHAQKAKLEIKDSFNLSLNCAHARVGADFQWGYDATSKGSDDYGVRIRLLDTDGKTWALFGIISPSEAGQAGFGFFGARIVVDKKTTETSLQLDKTDSRSGKGIAGVQFNLHEIVGNKDYVVGVKGSNGNYTEFNGDGRTNTLVTDSNGRITVKVNDAGSQYKYYFKEIRPANGYKMPSNPNTTQKSVSENSKQTFSMKNDTTTEKEKKAFLSITKTSSQPSLGYSLAGATYYVSGENDSGYLYTGFDGTSNILELQPGSYIIKEVSAPEGFRLNPNPISVSLANNEHKSITLDGRYAEEPIMARIGLLLNKQINGDPVRQPLGNIRSLAGIQFKVSFYKGEYSSLWETRGHNPECSITLETNADGKLDLDTSNVVSGSWKYTDSSGHKAAPLGTITVEEVKTLEGLRLHGSAVYQVRANGQNAEVVHVSGLNNESAKIMENLTYFGGVRVIKLDNDFHESKEQGDACLEGVQYDIINDSIGRVKLGDGRYINKGQKVTTITTKKVGNEYVAETSRYLLPSGTYTVKEVKSSEGYKNGGFEKKFIIKDYSQDGDYTTLGVGTENAVQRGNIELTKADFDFKKSESQGDATLAGTEYRLINKSKNPVFVAGRIFEPGQEIKRYKAQKIGGEYKVVIPEKTLPYGSYRIEEVKASLGYNMVAFSKDFKITKEGDVVKFNTSSNWSENKVQRGGLEVVKADFDLDQSTPQGDATLEGVQYNVVNRSKNAVFVNGKRVNVGDVVTTITTKKVDGVYKAVLPNNALPYGTYDVVEVKNAQGYLLTPYTKQIQIRQDKEIVKLDYNTVWNKDKVQRGGLELTKADFDLHKSIPQGDADLENTEYKITNKSKMPVVVNGQTYGVNAEIMKVKAHKQSDGTYKVVLANNTLPYGSYNIEEVLPSSTYNKIAFSKDFKIRKDKEVIKFNTQDNWSENKVQRGGLEVTKADHDLHKSVEQGDATLLNTEYTVINRSKLPVYVNGKVYKVGDTIMNIKTKKVNGVYKAIIPNETLPIGTYQVKEVNPPVGYNLLTFDKTFKIIKDKQMVTFNDVSNWSENAVKRGGLEVTKSDHDWHKSSEQGDATLENTEYEVINKSKMPVFVNGTVYKQNEKIMNILSKKQKDGTYKAIVPNNTLPYGTYQVRETKAPIGYNLLPFDKTFTIRAQDEIAKFNDVKTWSENAVKRGGLEVTKADHDLHQSIPQGDANLEDTEYKITNKSKQPVFVNGKTYEVGKEIMRIKVKKQKDDTYKAIVPNNTLPYGTYNVSETTPSSTYNKIAFSKDFSIREEKQVIKYNDVKNWSENKVKRGGFEVTKADHDLHQSVEQGDATLENTEYTIINRSKLPVYVNGKVYKVGETIMNIKTAKQKDGIYKAIIKNETLPIGTYQIKEVAPPVGYNLITFDKIFKITEDKQIIEFNDAKTWSENAVKRGGLEITKADFDLHKSIPQGDADLEDTEYAIVNKSKMPVFVNGVVYKVDEEIMRVKAHKQKDGIYKAIIPDNTLPYGTYNVYETKSSSTYNMLDKQHNFNKTFSIREEKQVVKFNEPSNWSENKVQRGGLEITKADNDLHKSVEQGDATLEDTEYTIINRSKLPVFVNGKVYKVGDTIMNFKSKKQKDGVYKAIIPNETLPIGTYQVKEVNPPVGYNLIPFDKTFKIVKDKQMMIYNQVSDWSENAVKRGGFEVTKADFDLHKSIPQGDADLENTEYAITNKSKMPVFVNGKLYKVNEEIMRIKAHKQKDGVYKAIIGNNVLPYGTYNITEIASSSTYNKIAYSKTFSIREEKQVIKFNDVKTWSENKVQRGGLEITKADNDLHKSVNQGDATLENTEYTLINKSKLPVFVNGQLIKVGGTVMNIQAKKQKDGTFKAIVPNETLPIGTYQVREVQPSEGYNMLMFDKTFRITEDKQIIKYNDVKTWSENKIKRGGLEVTKADHDLHKSIPQGDADLANTEYAITNKSKMPVFVNGKVHKVNDVIMTIKTEKDSKGVYKAVIANGTLPYGTYNITETKASSTYNKIDFSKDFKIREDNQMITFNDVKTWSENKVKRGGLEITKADFDLKKSIEQGDATLENTEYTVINKSKLPVFVNGKVYKVNDTIMTINTKKQKDGVYKAIIPNETLPIGTYQVKETKAPKGYNLVTFDKTFKITEDKQMIKYNDVKTWSENKVIRGGFKFEKIDREIKQPIGLGQATLEGVKFKVVNRSKMPVVVNGKLVKVGETALDVEMKLVKDKDGKPHYIYESAKNTLPYGTYEAIETATGNGYLLDESQKFTFKIVKEGEIVDLTSKPVTNQVIREDFHFIKKDAETMERMANVPFVITSKTTGESHIIVTDENGEFNSSAWQTNETKGIKHSENTNINDRNGAVVKDSKGNYKVVKPNLLKSRTGVWFTGTDPTKTKWAKDGKSYTFNGVTVKVDDGLRAFPYDIYTIQELRSESNKGHKLIKATVVLHDYGDVKSRGIDLDYGTIDNTPVYLKSELTSKLTGSHTVENSESATIVDKLFFNNFDTKEELTVKSELRVVDKDGKDHGLAAEKTTKFKADMPNSTFDIVFENVNTKKYAGMNLVAIQTVLDKHGVLVSHADLKDKKQTVSIPEMRTTAKGDIDNEANAYAKTVKIKDTITYKNLEVGKTVNIHTDLHYKNVGELGKITDGGIVKDRNGKNVSVDKKFTPKKSDGTFEVEFEFEPDEKLAGHDTVVFEYAKYGDVEFMSHADIEDEHQTIKFPKLKTKASDQKDEDKYVGTSENEVVRDVVTVENLVKGKEYTVSGFAHIKTYDKDGKAKDEGIAKDKDGKDSYAETTFKATDTKMQVELLFNVDARKLHGCDLVMFEELSRDKVKLAIEANIENEEQTVHIVKVGTTLIDKNTNSHMVYKEAKEKNYKVTLVDTMKYENLTPGQKIKVTGQLYTNENGKAVEVRDVNGQLVQKTVEVEVKERNGIVEIPFEFEMKSDSDIKNFVAFERVYDAKTNLLIGSEEDINNKGQTVYVINIKTTLTGADGKSKDVKASKNIDLIDTVEYGDELTVGEEYTMIGELHLVKVDKDGKLIDGGKISEAKTKFKAKKEKGTVEVIFKGVDTEKLEDGTKLVAFEKLEYNGKIIAQHEDINDEDQTVVVKKESKTKEKTRIRLNTGAGKAIGIVSGLVVVFAIGAGFVVSKRRKDA